jgi:hypothetical protein
MNECELVKIKGKDGESWYKGKKIKRKVRNETRFPDRTLLLRRKSRLRKREKRRVSIRRYFVPELIQLRSIVLDLLIFRALTK